MKKLPVWVVGLGLIFLCSQVSGMPLTFANCYGKNYSGPILQDNPKYKFHEAATLSGIQVRPNKKTGTFLLTFDQLLTETGWLQVKNTAGKVLFSRTIQPARGGMAQILDIGRLNPGLYSIEVKTVATTFWKKIRIRK
jgi:hypothetical protein